MADTSRVDTGEETFAHVVKRMRAALPVGHPDLKTVSDYAREQGIGPFDAKRAHALAAISAPNAAVSAGPSTSPTPGSPRRPYGTRYH